MQKTSRRDEPAAHQAISGSLAVDVAKRQTPLVAGPGSSGLAKTLDELKHLLACLTLSWRACLRLQAHAQEPHLQQISRDQQSP